MTQSKKNHYAKVLVTSVIALSLVACSSGNESISTNSPNDSISSSPPSSVSSSQTTTSSASVAIPGVKDAKEINFKSEAPQEGYFDGINGSTAPKQEVSNTAPIQVSGWAVLASERRPADRVLITYGNNNSLVAVAPVNLERPDVVKALNNPAYKNSGWRTTINPSQLPVGRVPFQAWAYNSASKEATPLNPTYEVVITK